MKKKFTYISRKKIPLHYGFCFIEIKLKLAAVKHLERE